MPKFNVAVDHAIPRSEAVVLLRSFSDQMREQSAIDITIVEETWDTEGNLTFSFKALGFSVSGTMVTCNQFVTVSGKIPFAAVPFRGAIESQIAENIRSAIA